MQKATNRTISLAEEILDLIKHNVVENVELKYNKYYIGLSINGKTINFASFQPQKNSLKFEFKISQSDDLEKALEQFEPKYNRVYGNYGIIINNSDEIKKNKDLFIRILKEAATSRGIII